MLVNTDDLKHWAWGCAPLSVVMAEAVASRGPSGRGWDRPVYSVDLLQPPRRSHAGDAREQVTASRQKFGRLGRS